MVRWLRHHTSAAGDTGLIPGRETKIPHSMWHGQKNRKKIFLIKREYHLLWRANITYQTDQGQQSVSNLCRFHCILTDSNTVGSQDTVSQMMRKRSITWSFFADKKTSVQRKHFPSRLIGSIKSKERLFLWVFAFRIFREQNPQK